MTDAQGVLLDIPMPQMGVSVTEGTVLEWRVAVGEEVAADQTLCEISTDKIDTDLPAPVAGTLAEIAVQAGETVAVGTLLARLETNAAVPAPAPVAEAEVSPAAVESPAQSATPQDGRRYSPVVRRIAEAHGIDLAQVAGTGRAGRVTKHDVMAFVEGGGAAPASAAGSPVPATLESAPMSRMRLAIAEHMTASKRTAAHCHTWIEVDMSGVEARRRELGLTALPLIAQATCQALAAHPSLNAWVEGETRTLHRDVNLGIAVSLGEDGLIVPVIHGAQALGAEELGARIRELAERARGGALKPDEVAGGTFTITNPGRAGTLMAAPIINQPQVGILDVEAIAKRPVVITDEHGNDFVGVRPTAILGLAWDHRAIDGALASEFLGTLRDILQRIGVPSEVAP
jgi:pyruvate/2-oxoglutarate dehydrogenase complex dihydrolipoamide acyltransferase (E2) component